MKMIIIRITIKSKKLSSTLCKDIRLPIHLFDNQEMSLEQTTFCIFFTSSKDILNLFTPMGYLGLLGYYTPAKIIMIYVQCITFTEIFLVIKSIKIKKEQFLYSIESCLAWQVSLPDGIVVCKKEKLTLSVGW